MYVPQYPHILRYSYRKRTAICEYDTCIWQQYLIVWCVKNKNYKKYRKFTFEYEIIVFQRVSKYIKYNEKNCTYQRSYGTHVCLNIYFCIVTILLVKRRRD